MSTRDLHYSGEPSQVLFSIQPRNQSELFANMAKSFHKRYIFCLQTGLKALINYCICLIVRRVFSVARGQNMFILKGQSNEIFDL